MCRQQYGELAKWCWHIKGKQPEFNSFLFVDVAFVFAVYQLISFVILGFHERVIEYSQWTVSWAYASTSLVTLFHVLHLYRCPLSFLETFSITKVSPVCKTVLLPSWVQMICEGGLLDALQKKVTLSYSRTVLFLGAETISAASEREANKNNSWSKKLFWRIRRQPLLINSSKLYSGLSLPLFIKGGLQIITFLSG